MRILNDTLAVNGVEISKSPIDLTTAINIDPMWLGHSSMFSVQLQFTGAPEGEFKLQVSNDHGVSHKGEGFYDLRQLGLWTDVDCSEQLVSEAGDHTWNFENPGFRWARVVWTPTGGSGELISARVNAKGV